MILISVKLATDRTECYTEGMRLYRIAEIKRTPAAWAVIATNDDGSQDWLSEHDTEADARAAADRLASKPVTRTPKRPWG
jgi:hypothetical protein